MQYGQNTNKQNTTRKQPSQVTANYISLDAVSFFVFNGKDRVALTAQSLSGKIVASLLLKINLCDKRLHALIKNLSTFQ